MGKFPEIERALESVSAMSWIGSADRRLLIQSLEEWRPDLLPELSWFSRRSIPVVRDGRHIDLYADGDVFRVPLSHPGNPCASSFYVDQDRRLLPMSCIELSQPVRFVGLVEPVLHLVESLDLGSARDIPVPTFEVQRWFSRNLGHVLDEWFSLAALSMEVPFLRRRLPVYEESPHWEEDLAAKFEVAAAAIFRGSALNISTVGGMVQRSRGVAIVRHTTQDRDFLRFHRSVVERALPVCKRLEHRALEGLDFGERVFLMRTAARQPSDAVANLAELAALAAAQGFTVINPEELRLSQLVVGLRRTKTVVATWGSALTLCAFMARGASVLALRTGRYLNEQRDLIWGNLIDEHQLLFSHLDASEGVIDIEEFRKSLQHHLGVDC